MKCPIDGETLVITERSGVEIDYCPKCRGVWLDRGELDKIIERSETSARSSSGAGPWGEADRNSAPRRESRPKRRESFLSELFDFDL